MRARWSQRHPFVRNPAVGRAVAGHPVVSLVLALGLLAVLAPTASAHGADALVAPTPPEILLDWAFDPLVSIPVLLVGAAYLWAVRRVDRAHPGNTVPRSRVIAFVAGLAAIEIALQSIIERYDTTLFSVHMVQHILLTLVAPPLLALGAPITLALRVASPAVRHGVVLPILHSRLLRLLSFPVFAWLVFASVMWGTHFSPIFNESLEQPLVHQLEHVAYLAVDPSPWRIPHPVRAMYLFLQMPQNTFLALAIYSAAAPLYPHYAAIRLPWAPSPLADQQIAGGLMWIVGDIIFIVAIVFTVVGWMRSEEREAVGRERREDAQIAAIRAREAALADRLAADRLAGDRLAGEQAGDDTASRP
jgi:putative membrane protein